MGSIHNQRNAVDWQGQIRERPPNDIDNCLIGAQGIAASPENHGVSRLKTEAERIRRNIRAGFVNNADYAQRHSFLPDLQSVWHRFHANDFPDRIGQGSNLPESFCHCPNTLLRETQPIDKRIFHSRVFGPLYILCSRLQKRLGIFLQRYCHSHKSLIFLLFTKSVQCP